MIFGDVGTNTRANIDTMPVLWACQARSAVIVLDVASLCKLPRHVIAQRIHGRKLSLRQADDCDFAPIATSARFPTADRDVIRGAEAEHLGLAGVLNVTHGRVRLEHETEKNYRFADSLEMIAIRWKRENEKLKSVANNEIKLEIIVILKSKRKIENCCCECSFKIYCKCQLVEKQKIICVNCWAVK
jgi:hypothetical protein